MNQGSWYYKQGLGIVIIILYLYLTLTRLLILRNEDNNLNV